MSETPNKIFVPARPVFQVPQRVWMITCPT